MNKGFTLIEVLLVITVVGILLSLSTFNLIQFQEKSYINSTVETVLSDIKHQQLKAMSGATEGGAAADSFGLKFNTNNYILFKGTTFDGTNSTNFTVDIDDSLEFGAVSFPQSQIVFTKGSGEITNFSAGNNTITIRHIGSNATKTITVNKYGAITQVQ